MSTLRKDIRPKPDRSVYTRRRVLALALAALIIFTLVRLLGGGSLPDPPTPGFAAGAVPGNPFAYSAAGEAAFSERATLGEAQVLFTLSPGGVLATAQRVAAYRAKIDAAVRGTNIPASLLEGLVFVESAGRSQVIAGSSVTDAAGLTQILAGTGKQMLAMKINLRRSASLTGQIAAAQAAGDNGRALTLESERARIDQRFDPTSELAATVRYLRTAEASLGGRPDLAVAAYHAGIGNIEHILTLYDGGAAVPYVQLYFDLSPTQHSAAWQALTTLPDDGALYYWRVLGAERVMSLWRHNRPALRSWARQSEAFPSNALVLLGVAPGSTPALPDPAAVAQAYWTKPAATLVPLPRNAAALHLAYAPSMGASADRVGAPAAIYRGLAPTALRMLIQISAWVDQIAGSSAPLTVLSTVRDPKYSHALGLGGDLPAASGYTFQIARSYASVAQRDAFQFVLDRLQALNLIAWLRDPEAIEITVAPDAASVITNGIRD